jgi:hypothetical protein
MRRRIRAALDISTSPVPPSLTFELHRHLAGIARSNHLRHFLHQHFAPDFTVGTSLDPIFGRNSSMRRTRRALVVSVAALGTIGLAGGVASAAPTPTHDILRLRGHSLTFSYGGPNQNAPTPGYSFSFSEAIYPASGNKRIGTDYVNCDIITKSATLCTGTWVLNDRGQISVQGAVPFNTKPGQRFTLSVVGGTRQFLGARGSVTITSEPDDAFYTPQVFQLYR